jgi:DNA-binding transcriptional LysR family regulator
MFPWDDLRVFLATCRTGSHAGAARTLGVAATTVGRRLAALEDAVGARLFARTPDGLAPTAAAQALLPRAERMEAEANEAERALTGADTRVEGEVRLTCGEGFAEYILAPALPGFLAAHPGLTLEVRGGVRSLDLTRGEAEIALRNFRPRERSLVARRLGTEPLGLYAAASYLAARGTPRSAADLEAHDLILYDREFEQLRSQAWFRSIAPRARVSFRANSTTLMHAACAAGAGVALLSRAFVEGDPRYVRALPRLATPELELWSAAHGDLRASARVTATLRFIEALVRRPGFGTA